jgi:hypothetical protein
VTIPNGKPLPRSETGRYFREEAEQSNLLLSQMDVSIKIIPIKLFSIV